MVPDRYNPVTKMQSPLDLSSSTLGSSSSLSAVGHVTSNPRNIVLPLDPRQNPQTGLIITKIEEILIANIDALTENRVLTIPVRNRRTGNLQRVRFPSSRNTEAKKFSTSYSRSAKLACSVPVRFTHCFLRPPSLAALLQILHLSHESLVAGTVITKRSASFILFCRAKRSAT